MSDPYVGEIRMFGGNFAPRGWALCNGQVLAIEDYVELYSLIGTTYGGDGQTTFALPNLQSRVPMHVGNGHALGEVGGSETVTLTVNQLPDHGHTPQASSAGTGTSPTGNAWANSAAVQFAASNSALAPMHSNAIAASGGSQPHDNMLPYQAVNFIISLFGLIPPQS
jgi:microcystin-dependent protein